MDALMNQRRLRGSRWIRDLVREIHLSETRLIQPLFAAEGIRSREAVPGLPGVHRETKDSILTQIDSDLEKGVRKFILFGVPSSKQEDSFSHAFTSSVISGIKERFGSDLFLFVDVCLCSHTSSGHCGVLNEEGDHLENDASVKELARAALEYAEAGADGVAPSDMMDGRVRAIRETLAEADLDRVVLMSYAAKFHSRFYGPFRVAADSAPAKGASPVKLKDRATYQIDPAAPADALASALRDREEGADLLMVKPGLPYLDMLVHLRQALPDAPLAAYEVSGEYAAIEALAEKNLIDAPRAHLECWTALHRAGAGAILTYGARFARDWIKKSEEYT